MSIVSVFDFDGTLIFGDSIKIALSYRYKNRITFIWKYYLSCPGGLFLSFFGNYTIIRLHRKKLLRESLVWLESSDFGCHIKSTFIVNSINEMKEALNGGQIVVLVTASFKELVSLMLSDYQNITIIAESLYEQLPRIINGEEKAVLLREFLADNNYDILRVFGNTKGDFAMLKMAEEPFWVNKTGEVSVWKEFV